MIPETAAVVLSDRPVESTLGNTLDRPIPERKLGSLAAIVIHCGNAGE
jgi:hypothetical protein